MPRAPRECVICRKPDAVAKKFYLTIKSIESETKIRTGYRHRYQHDIQFDSLQNMQVHRTCYVRVTRKLSPIPPRKKTIQTHADMFDDDDMEPLDEQETIDEKNDTGKREKDDFKVVD
jgi:hypothetical protein